MPSPDLVLARRIAAARDDVSSARAVVARCRDVPWVAPAGDAYRQAVDETHGSLVALRDRLDALLDDLHAPALRVPRALTVGEIAAAGWCGSTLVGGRAVRVGGAGFVAVDPDALADAGDRLGGAARALDGVGRALSVIGPGTANPWQACGAADDAGAAQRSALTALAALLSGPLAPHRCSDRVGALAATTREAARAHAGAESGAAGLVRSLVSGGWRVFTANPLFHLGDPESRRALTTAGAFGVWADPRWRGAVQDATGTAAESFVAAGGVEALVVGLAVEARAMLPAMPAADLPVTQLAPLLSLGLATTTPPISLVGVPDPPQLPPPVGLAGVVGLVGHGYDAGTPPATVTVQRLDHPDGTRSWVVAIPGTQSMGLLAAAPTDMGTNLRLEAGWDDGMSTGVLDAMRVAGIPPDEPVLLAGHSQGGMVAMAVASLAAGSYRVVGVVTAGSPTVPRALPASVPVVRLEHDEDAVPQLDGEPTAAGPDITLVTRSVAQDDLALPGGPHHIDAYVRTARLADEGMAAAPGSVPAMDAVARVLGEPGTTATTVQLSVTRAPAVTASPAGGR